MAQFKHTSPIGGLKHLKQRIDELNLFKVEIGWFPSSQHPTKSGGTIPMATIAHNNEFGQAQLNIPPRPFIRPALAENRRVWREQIKQGAKGLIQGLEKDEDVMEKIGLSVSGYIRAHIAQVHDPELSPRTIASRLSVLKDQTTIGNLDKPLVFTGVFLNSVTYKVADGQEITPYETGNH